MVAWLHRAGWSLTRSMFVHEGPSSLATPRQVASHPAAIPRTPPFIAVRQRVDNSVTCPDGSSWSLIIRHKHLRNVEVGGSSPLTSTVYFGFACFFAYGQGADLRVLCWAPPSSTGLSTEFIDGLSKLP